MRRIPSRRTCLIAVRTRHHHARPRHDAGSLTTAEQVGTAIRHPPPRASADFALSVNYGSPSFVGNLVRGATFGTPCNQCNGGAVPQPAYVVPDPFGCFYDSNQIGVTSLNGFTGTVNLSLKFATGGHILHPLRRCPSPSLVPPRCRSSYWPRLPPRSGRRRSPSRGRVAHSRSVGAWPFR